MPARAPRRALARLAVVSGVAALALGACAAPPASPTPVPAASDSRTETRALAPFTAVSVSGPLNLVLASGDSPSVAVDGPSNLLPLVTTNVAGSELDVTVAAPGFTSAKPVTVRITGSTANSVTLSGGATGTIEAMGQSMAVSVSSGASVKGIGVVRQLTVTVVGNSTAELGDLAADAASISLAGGATAILRVAKQLTGTADGGSVVTLMVAPEAKSVALTGGAKIVGP